MVEKYSKLAVTLLALAAPGAVLAAEPVAIVQSVEASGTSVRAMELIERGRVFELGAKGRLVLGYFRSCLHEEITGGRVTVGVRESRVEGGRVARRRVECDGRVLDLTRGQAANSSVLMFRRPPSEHQRVVIQRTSPVIGVLGEAGVLTSF